jgi:hypothetical protein
MDRISNEDARKVRCAGYHGGSHKVVMSRDRTNGECQGCMTHFTAEQVREALETDRPAELGQGGLTRL